MSISGFPSLSQFLELARSRSSDDMGTRPKESPWTAGSRRCVSGKRRRGQVWDLSQRAGLHATSGIAHRQKKRDIGNPQCPAYKRKYRQSDSCVEQKPPCDCNGSQKQKPRPQQPGETRPQQQDDKTEGRFHLVTVGGLHFLTFSLPSASERTLNLFRAIKNPILTCCWI